MLPLIAIPFVAFAANAGLAKPKVMLWSLPAAGRAQQLADARKRADDARKMADDMRRKVEAMQRELLERIEQSIAGYDERIAELEKRGELSEADEATLAHYSIARIRMQESLSRIRSRQR